MVGGGEPDPKAKRLDYIFVGGGEEEEEGEGGGWLVQSARVCMTERHPELRCSLSDHFAVEAEIVWKRGMRRGSSSSSSGGGSMGTGAQNGQSGLDHAHGDGDDPYSRVENKKKQQQQQQQNETVTTENPSPSPPSNNNDTAIYPTLLVLIASYTARQRLHRRRRCTHFLASVAVTLACFVAVWFSPAHYVSFLLLVLSSLGLMAGTVDGLIGLLFGGSELRALKEWEGEVRRVMRGEVGLMGEGGWEEEVEIGRVRDWWD